MSNTIQYNWSIDRIHFSLCGKFIFIKQKYYPYFSYSTYSVSPDHQSLSLVNQFQTSEEKHIAALCNDDAVVVLVDDDDWFSYLKFLFNCSSVVDKINSLNVCYFYKFSLVLFSWQRSSIKQQFKSIQL